MEGVRAVSSVAHTADLKPRERAGGHMYETDPISSRADTGIPITTLQRAGMLLLSAAGVATLVAVIEPLVVVYPGLIGQFLAYHLGPEEGLAYTVGALAIWGVGAAAAVQLRRGIPLQPLWPAVTVTVAVVSFLLNQLRVAGWSVRDASGDTLIWTAAAAAFVGVGCLVAGRSLSPTAPGPVAAAPAAVPAGQGQAPPLTTTIVISALLGPFGAIPASKHSRAAAQVGARTGRYWVAFAVSWVVAWVGSAILAVAIMAALYATLLASLS
jgi:hypothetical protein